jgi:hypothetical protein
MRYICIPCVTPYSDGEQVVDACFVTAEDPNEAALKAADAIASEKPESDELYLGTIYVIEAEKYEILARHAHYSVRHGDPTELCCGGIGEGQHSGYCRNRKGEPD